MTTTVARRPDSSIWNQARLTSAADIGHRAGSPSLGIASLVSSAGLLAVAGAYAMGRSHIHGALAVYWVALLATFSPLAIWVLRGWGRQTRDSSILFMLVLAIQTYLIKFTYSPLHLKYGDELFNSAGAANAILTQRIGGGNPALPIAAKFPGLESLTASICTATGLSVNSAGLLLAGIMHLGITLSIGAIGLQLFRSPSMASLAVLTYATGGGFVFFNSFYVYENLALVFALLTILFAVRIRDSRYDPRVSAVLTLSFNFLTIMSHHVTAIFVSAILVLAAFFDLVLGKESRKAARLSVPIAVVSAAGLVTWLVVVSKGLGDYLAPYSTSITDSQSTGEIAIPNISSAAVEPVVEHWLSVSSALAAAVLVLLGSFAILRQRIDTWGAVLGICALGLIGVRGLYVIAPSRSVEVVGRSAPFIYVGAAFVIPIGLQYLSRTLPRRFPTSRLLSLLLVFLFVGGFSGGWPPWWERIPGSFVPKGFESGYDLRTMSAALWARDNLPPQSGFIADSNGLQVLSGIGNQKPSRDASPVFYGTNMSANILALKEYKIRYVWLDTRMTQNSPSGQYLSGYGAGIFKIPVPLSNLEKFTDQPGATLVYTDGVVSIYDYQGVS